jgi:hypothetical protein
MQFKRSEHKEIGLDLRLNVPNAFCRKNMVCLLTLLAKSTFGSAASTDLPAVAGAVCLLLRFLSPFSWISIAGRDVVRR